MKKSDEVIKNPRPEKTYSTKSWLFKYNKAVGRGNLFINAIHCKSVCAYFWSSVWNICMGSLALLIAYLVLTALGGAVMKLSFLASIPALSGLHVSLLFIPGILSILVFLIYVFIVIFGFTVITDLFKKLSTKRTEPKQFDENGEEIVKHKEPNIFIEWLKAKKNKHCPIIHFEDPDDSNKNQ
ncbi:membrane protein [Vibrio phage VB_VaC_TDDLMA]